MKTFTDKEYLALLQSISDQRYQDDEEDISEPKTDWIPPPVEQKILRKVSTNSVKDISLTANKEQIRQAITNYNNLQIGKITVKIIWHNEESCDTLNRATFNFSIYHEVNKTPSGQAAKLINPLNVHKDSRFTGQEWLHYFKEKRASAVPFETLVEIIRYCQVIQKLAAFL